MQEVKADDYFKEIVIEENDALKLSEGAAIYVAFKWP